MLDGEECMVIDLDQLIAEGEAEECTAVLSTASGDIGCPNGWMNRSVVEINNDNYYDSPFDLTRGDYYTPIFKVETTKQRYSFTFIIPSTFNQEYYLECDYILKNNLSGGWVYGATTTKTYNWTSSPTKLFLATASQELDGICVKILASSSGNKQAKYKVCLSDDII